jgi:PleD family two-component response regulator
VERGFNISKMFATDRESLSVYSMKALKMVFCEIKRQGGAEKVSITPTMLVQVKMAGKDARDAMEKEQNKKKQESATKASEREAARKRKAEEETKKKWEEEKKDLELELRSVQNYMDQRSKFIEGEMSKQSKCSDPYKIKDLATSIRLATEDRNKQARLERELQEKLRVHMGKKPRVGGS